jgi:hypothetical protein
LFRPDAFERINQPAQHMIAASKLAGVFNRQQIARFGYNAQEVRVPARVEANGTQLVFRKVAAALARANFLAHLTHSLREGVRIAAWGTQDVKSQALRRLGANARQAFELFQQNSQRPRVEEHSAFSY